MDDALALLPSTPAMIGSQAKTLSGSGRVRGDEKFGDSEWSCRRRGRSKREDSES